MDRTSKAKAGAETPGAVMLKRVYQPAEDHDGLRVLVDRIWPRGLTKAEARIDVWLKDAAPSTALRQRFGHRPDRWSEFQRRYLAELKDAPAFAELQRLAGLGDLTLVYAAKDEDHNNAVVLAERLRASPPSPKS